MFSASKHSVSLGLCCSLLVGCAEMGQFMREHPVLGTLVCAGIGAGTAMGTGSKPAGAGAGGGCLALLAISEMQTRSASEDRVMYSRKEPELYGLKPGDLARVKIRGRNATPGKVKTGRKITAVTDYSVITPDERQTVVVQESWILKKDNQLLGERKPKPKQRQAGGWKAEANIDVPPDAAPGTYVIEHKIQVGTSEDKDVSVFVVTS
jgi:hypothetical protein